MKKRRRYFTKFKVWQWPHIAIPSAPPLYACKLGYMHEPCTWHLLLSVDKERKGSTNPENHPGCIHSKALSSVCVCLRELVAAQTNQFLSISIRRRRCHLIWTRWKVHPSLDHSVCSGTITLDCAIHEPRSIKDLAQGAMHPGCRTRFPRATHSQT